jgi:hypothetical protein
MVKRILISSWLVLGAVVFVVSVLELLHEATNSALGGSDTAGQTAGLRRMATTQTIIAALGFFLVAVLFWSRRRWMQGSVALACLLWLISVYDFVLGAQAGAIP